jgi:hypothetical protein
LTLLAPRRHTSLDENARVVTQQRATDAKIFRELHSGNFLSLGQARHDPQTNGVGQRGQDQHVLVVDRQRHDLILPVRAIGDQHPIVK